jgi:hypothetical protein
MVRAGDMSAAMTREALIAAATVLHDEEGCSCDRKYLMSCHRMANAILRSGPAATASEAAPEAGDLPQRTKFVNGSVVPEFPDECEPHTESPEGYLQWHAWAERMSVTHVPRQCRGCGLWAIWEPKPGTALEPRP